MINFSNSIIKALFCALIISVSFASFKASIILIGNLSYFLPFLFLQLVKNSASAIFTNLTVYSWKASSSIKRMNKLYIGGNNTLDKTTLFKNIFAIKSINNMLNLIFNFGCPQLMVRKSISQRFKMYVFPSETWICFISGSSKISTGIEANFLKI